MEVGHRRWCRANQVAQPLMVVQVQGEGRTFLPALAMPQSTQAKQVDQAHAIFQVVQESPYLQDLIFRATSDVQKTFFINKLLLALPAAFAGQDASHSDLFGIMTTWSGKYNSPQFSAMDEALQQRKAYFTGKRHEKREFISRIGLGWLTTTRYVFLQTTRTAFLSELDTPYPLARHWICETDEIDAKWHSYLYDDPRSQPDRRRPRIPISLLDPAKLQLDIKADENALIYDRNTGELVLVVIRNFCQDRNLLVHIDEVIKQSVDCRKSIRVCKSNPSLPQVIHFY
jgi:hypothetical protein